MKTLLVVGHPRGFTSFTRRAAARACGLIDPIGTSDGEVLNPDRTSHIHDHKPFSVDTFASWNYSKILNFYAGNSGYAIKDVLQPYIVASWLEANPEKVNVLYVRRDPREVAICQRLRGWNHPIINLDALYGDYVSVEYEKLITDPDELWQQLEWLGYKVNDYNYITDSFVLKRENVRRKVENAKLECIAD